MLDKSSNTTEPRPSGGGGAVTVANDNSAMLGEQPDYVRAMLKITNCIVQGRFHEGVYYPIEGPGSGSEAESEEELSPAMPPLQVSTPVKSTAQQLQQHHHHHQQQQQKSKFQDAALQFHSVSFKAQQHKQHMQQLQLQQLQLQQYQLQQLQLQQLQLQQLQLKQQQQQQNQKDKSIAAIGSGVLEQQSPPSAHSSMVSKKLKRSEAIQDFAEKYWRETENLNRVFEDEDCFLVSNNKSSKHLSNLGRAVHTPQHRDHSRTEQKTKSDEPKGIALYLQPINHDLTFKTNSTVDKSTQI